MISKNASKCHYFIYFTFRDRDYSMFAVAEFGREVDYD